MIECKKCGSCCLKHPCGLIPEDLPRIARLMSITIEELIYNYLILDFYVGDGRYQYYLCPKRKGDAEGLHMAAWHWAFDWDRPCIFLTSERLCTIHDAKPYQGAISNCQDSGVDKEFLAKKWKYSIDKYIEMTYGNKKDKCI